MALKSAKNLLRKKIKEKLLNLSDEEKHKQSMILTKKLFSHEIYKSSNRVSIYLSMPDEVQTDEIVKDIFLNKTHCFIPHYEGNFMTMTQVQSVEELNELPTTSWNIKQPLVPGDDAIDTGGLDLIIVPGLAFTLNGKRLGRGKGYYDSYLSRCLQLDRVPVTIALAYNVQIVDDLPTTEHDIPLHFVISPD